MVYKADIVIFHSAVRPFFSALGIDSHKLENKKKLLYFHGSDLRSVGKELVAQANELLDNPQFLVSTPDLLLYDVKGAKWLPVTRSFSEIRRRHGLCNQDTKAKESFGVPKKKVVLAHAPTGEGKKGSALFYKVITTINKENPNATYLTIRNQTWFRCLRLLSNVDLYFDQNTPFICGYGMSSVEASIFKTPCFTRMFPEVIQLIKQKTGFDSPFITFTGEEDLLAKVLKLMEDSSLRRMFGNLTYKYCKAVHDEKPVVKRFLKIVEDMA